MKLAFGKACITPTEPSYLCGHAMRMATHTGVLDDIMIQVIRLETECDTYLFGSVDLVGLDEELVERMKQCASIYGILKEHTIISVIHTHAAPEFTEVNMFSNDPATGARPGYRDFLVTQFAKAIEDCGEGIEVEASIAKTQIEGFYSNRNHKDYPCDKSAYLIRFTHQEEPVLMIANLSCHPTILGPQNTLISADLFGALRKGLEENYHTPVFMMNGAQGDVSNRQYRQGNDAAELKRVSSGILEQLSNISFVPMDCSSMCVKDISYVIDYTSDPSSIEAEIQRAQEILKTETDPDILKVTKSGIAFLEHNKQENPHVHIKIKTRILRLGELTIVTVGGELFTKFSLAIKAAFPNHMIILWGITDASVGYLVEADEYGKNYESMTTRIPKGEVERYCDHIIYELRNMLMIE